MGLQHQLRLQKVKLEVRHKVAYLTMLDGAHLNALDMQMDKELLAALEYCEADNEVCVVVLRGEGQSFSAGGDMDFFKESLVAKQYEKLDALLVCVNRLILFMKSMRTLIIGEVQGYAAGGGANLGLACDYLIGEPNTTFIQSFTKIGLAPDAGGMYLLSKAIGARRALELCLEARPVKAEEALQLGLLNEVVPKEELSARAEALAQKWAAGSALAYGLTKYQNFVANYSDFESFLMETERQTVNETFASPDFAASVDAFLAKRQKK